MIRLTTIQPSPSEFVVRVEGRLDADAVGQLRGVIEQLRHSTPQRLGLHLGGVTAIDAPARDLLLSLRESGVRLTGGSVYLTQLLQEPSP